jgi:alkaline phosphatase
MNNLISIVILLTLSVSAFAAKPKYAKNIIFIVGDGMGISSLTGTRIYSQGAKGELNIEKFKTIGLVKTFSSDNYTTDSAAGATAFASGVKTYNGAIGVSDKRLDKKGKSRPLQTVFDIARSVKKSIGIVTTTRVTHATPACFYAHVDKRNKENEIAAQLQNSKLDFLLGGGESFFTPFKEKLQKSGWNYITTKKQLDALRSKDSKAPVIGLFNKDHLSFSIHNKNEPELVDLVSFGLNRLKKNKNGYFFMIEAGRIDHAGHANLAKEQFGEVLALDKTVAYLLKNVDLKNTLIILTADHETGGLALNGYGDLNKVKGEHFLKGESKKGDNSFISWATGSGSKNESTDKSAYHMKSANHTSVDVPIYSIGFGHQTMGGFMQNSDISHKILKVMGLKFTDPVNTTGKAF